MRHTYISLAIILLSIVAATAYASEQDAENTFKEFEGKLLVLRHPLQGSSQEYDAEGKALKGGDEGPWTVYGGVHIDKVSLSPHKLRFGGCRILFLFLKGKFTAMEFKRLKRPVDPPFPPSVQAPGLNRLPGADDQARNAISSQVWYLSIFDLSIFYLSILGVGDT